MVLNPSSKESFNEIVNGNCGAKVPVVATIIPNHRAKNLGDPFFIRNIEKNPPSIILGLDELGGAFFATSGRFQSFCLPLSLSLIWSKRKKIKCIWKSFYVT